MEAAGVAPTAVTYGCLLSACERLCQVPDRSAWAVQRAFELYREVRCALRLQVHALSEYACCHVRLLTWHEERRPACLLVSTLCPLRVPMSRSRQGICISAKAALICSPAVCGKQACGRGITPTDGCHNVLIRICTATGQCAPGDLHLCTPESLTSASHAHRRCNIMCNVGCLDLRSVLL